MRLFSYATKILLLGLSLLILLLFVPHPHKEAQIFISPNTLYIDRLSSFSKVVYPFPGLLINPAKIKFGVYKIKKNCNYISVFRTITYNKQASLPFRIKDGMSVVQIKEEMLQNQNFRGNFPENIPEGAIIPNTYQFAYGTNRSRAIQHILQVSQAKRDKLWKANEFFANQQEWIIFASILEKEGISYEDKRKIAGVILNRMKKKMRLEIDATAIYIKTGGRYDKKLTWNEVQSGKFNLDQNQNEIISYRSPYNTYRNKGLPPGPICNPGVESLAAALNPETHNYLYYRLIDGKHVFSEDFQQHKGLMQSKK